MKSSFTFNRADSRACDLRQICLPNKTLYDVAGLLSANLFLFQLASIFVRTFESRNTSIFISFDIVDLLTVSLVRSPSLRRSNNTLLLFLLDIDPCFWLLAVCFLKFEVKFGMGYEAIKLSRSRSTNPIDSFFTVLSPPVYYGCHASQLQRHSFDRTVVRFSAK